MYLKTGLMNDCTLYRFFVCFPMKWLELIVGAINERCRFKTGSKKSLVLLSDGKELKTSSRLLLKNMTIMHLLYLPWNKVIILNGDTVVM